VLKDAKGRAGGMARVYQNKNFKNQFRVRIINIKNFIED